MINVIYGIFAIYLILVNIAAFYMYGLDKRYAKAGRRGNNGASVKRRIPEKVLLIAAAIGGAAGAYIGMRVYHHKTTKKKFCLGVPALLVLECFVVMFLITRL